MKKRSLYLCLFTALTLCVAMLGIAAPVSAIDVISPICNNQQAVSEPRICNDAQQGLTGNPFVGDGGVFEVAFRLLSFLAGLSAIIFIIVAGLKMIFSNGDSSTFATARKQLIYSVIGLVVVMAANLLVTMVLSRISEVK